jgi:hypothetical protein
MPDDAEDEIEDMENSLDNSIDSSWKKIGIGLAVVLLAAGIFVVGSGIIPLDSQQPVQETNNSRDSEDLGQVGLSPSDIPGEIVDVNISGISAEPFRPEIAPDDGIRFHNNKDVQIKFVFDRGVPNFTMASGEATIVDVNNIVYYEIFPDEEGIKTAAEGGSFRVIQGAVNVQS